VSDAEVETHEDRKPEPTLAGSTDVLVHERASAMRPPTAAERAHAHARHHAGMTTADARAQLGEPIAAPLRALQEWFAAVTTHPESLEAGLTAGAKAHPSLGGIGVDEAARVVIGDARLDALSRLGVYHDAYRARLVECLADDYPAVQYLLGEDTFTEVCHAYIAANPSRGPSLNPYGEKMTAFLAQGAGGEAIAGELAPFATDLAQLEWALVEVIHAAKAPVLDPAALQAIPAEAWSHARLPPAETLRLVRGRYPVNRFFQQFKQDEGPGIPDLTAPAPTAVAVYRVGFVLWRMDLTAAMAELLAGLMHGATLGEALGAIDESTVTDAAELAEAERQVMAWFQSWVANGFFAGVEVG
jgi:hypothetical protein